MSSTEISGTRDEAGRLLPGHPYRFPPGESPNPGGRPKKTPLTDAYRDFLEKHPGEEYAPRTNAEAIALAEIRKAQTGAKGSTEAMRGAAELTGELRGRGEEGKPGVVNQTLVVIGEMSVEEKLDFLRRYAPKLIGEGSK